MTHHLRYQELHLSNSDRGTMVPSGPKTSRFKDGPRFPTSNRGYAGPINGSLAYTTVQYWTSNRNKWIFHWVNTKSK